MWKSKKTKMTKRMLCPQRYAIPGISRKRKIDENDDEGENASMQLSIVPRLVQPNRGVCSYGSKNLGPRASEASLNGRVSATVDLSSLHFSRIGPLELSGMRCELFANFIAGSIVHECEYNRASSRLRSEFFSRRAALHESRTLHKTKYRNQASLLVDRTPFALVWRDPVSGEDRLVNNTDAIQSLVVELYLQIVKKSDSIRLVRALLDCGVNVVITGDTETRDDSAPKLSHEMLASICWERVLCDELNANR